MSSVLINISLSNNFRKFLTLEIFDLNSQLFLAAVSIDGLRVLAIMREDIDVESWFI